MRVYGLVQDSIVDGPGLRFAVFVQGCPHRCLGCHNPDSHNPFGGKEMNVKDIISEMLKSPFTDGLTLSGGEPFSQPEECLALAKVAHANCLNVWCYSGWTFENLLYNGSGEERKLLQEVDTLVDGPFILAERTLSLPWRGSRNQRIIDVKKSISTGKVVEVIQCL